MEVDGAGWKRVHGLVIHFYEPSKEIYDFKIFKTIRSFGAVFIATKLK